MRLSRSRLVARIEPVWRRACRVCALWPACALTSARCCLARLDSGVARAHARATLVVDVVARRVVGRSLVRTEGLCQRARVAPLQVAPACVRQWLGDAVLTLCAPWRSQMHIASKG